MSGVCAAGLVENFARLLFDCSYRCVNDGLEGIEMKTARMLMYVKTVILNSSNKINSTHN